ncbi:MAG: hypothetical protein Q9192_008236, partial [Flavoplaca navasiana]
TTPSTPSPPQTANKTSQSPPPSPSHPTGPSSKTVTPSQTSPKWTTGNIWAPSITRLPTTGLFILYFSGTSETDPSKHCIGAATSHTILGPYYPSPDPLIYDLAAGGAIDASPFLDPKSGTLYLIWKTDGNSLGGGGPCGNANSSHSTPLQIAPLHPRTGTSFLANATAILDRDPEYDGPVNRSAEFGLR